jgi:hypothetical protein
MFRNQIGSKKKRKSRGKKYLLSWDKIFKMEKMLKLKLQLKKHFYQSSLLSKKIIQIKLETFKAI